MAADRQPPHHNTLTCYTDYRCRLPRCVDRYKTWCRDRDRAIAEGTWQPLLDAEPVRQHLLGLHAAGITIHRVATLTGLTYKSVRSFTQHDYGNAAPRRHRVTREVAAKILAINLDEHTPGHVTPIGSQRRFEALVAIGWPTIHTARRAGIHPSNRVTIFKAPTMRASTAQRIAAAYDEMRQQKPARHGVSATCIKRAKKQAAERRWAPPKYWDEVGAIDDPGFEPMYGITRREIVAQDANELMRISGLDRHAAAERLGVTKSYIDHAFREFPQYALEVAA
ncbi:hypothetical protein AB0F36_14465 [Streptomyces sp. NPDC029080]|uniref:hypothetical protein n=1 Tax=Streptomyces sp. NPDC029080 TaxID=3155017 RepID=UPI0034101925